MRQANLSRSRAGVLRGMHFHRWQADLWVPVRGSAFVGLFDLRSSSASGERKASLRLEAAEPRALYIPPGVAHGFAAVEAFDMLYLVDREFAGDDEHGVAWDDPDLGIEWPLDDPVLSDRDRANPTLAAVLEDRPVG